MSNPNHHCTPICQPQGGQVNVQSALISWYVEGALAGIHQHSLQVNNHYHHTTSCPHCHPFTLSHSMYPLSIPYYLHLTVTPLPNSPLLHIVDS